MRVCLINSYSVSYMWQERLAEMSGQDVIVFGFNGLGLVSYKKELEGETEYFHDVARLSKQTGSVVISGCDTDTYGTFRHSVIISDKGKILGVSDMAHSIDDSEYVAGGNFRVYDTSAGKLGIIVGEDLFFPETSRVLTLCDADVIICVLKKMDNMMPQVMLRACAFSNGIPMVLCAKNYCVASNIRGEVTASSRASIIKTEVKTEKDYHFISSRRRGLYRDFNSGY